jgi:hypothetical protein
MPDLNELLNTYLPALAGSNGAVSAYPSHDPWQKFSGATDPQSRLDVCRAIARRAPFFQLTPTAGAFSNSLSSSGPLHSTSRFAGMASRVVGTSRPWAVKLWSPVLSVDRPTR